MTEFFVINVIEHEFQSFHKKLVFLLDFPRAVSDEIHRLAENDRRYGLHHTILGIDFGNEVLQNLDYVGSFIWIDHRFEGRFEQKQG